MIEKIIAWCARNQIFVFIAAGAAILWAGWSLAHIPLDALPDLGDTQVIVYSKWDRPPQVIEDQVTFPIISSLLGAPKVKDIRGFSDYGYSYVYVIFEDGTDLYWARSRVLEYLSKVSGSMPAGAKVELGPDATGIGWIYEYALVDESGKHTLDELRSFQDWKLRFALQSVKGVAEVASVGGSVRQYQITPDPMALEAYQLSIADLVKAVQSANNEMGARLLDLQGREAMVTVRGYLKSPEDLESVVLRVVRGVPIRLRDVAKVGLGPDLRRGVAEFGGRGEVAGGIVVMRQGENAMAVIERVKEKVKELKLPEGVKFVPTYDRSELIRDSIRTLRTKLIEELVVVALVILIFLLHVPSALVPIITLPIAVLLSFIPMQAMGLSSNIMSLGGIAIAIGAMVDASIVMVENGHKKLHAWDLGGQKGDYRDVLIRAAQEVGRPAFFSLIVIAVSFMPIFTLEGMEGRLFRPLAFTKNYAMFFGALLAITLAPAVQVLLIRVKPLHLKGRLLNLWANRIFVGKIHGEENHPISRALSRVYDPVVRAVLRHPKRVIAGAALLFFASLPLTFFIGSEFMPPLNEGSILYMPTTLPGISVTEASRLLQIQNRLLAKFPEVETIFGKAGRAETATDPAPFSMMETTLVLKPQHEWRERRRWYSWLPEALKGPLRIFWPDRISLKDLIAEMDLALKLPGQVNAWTLPIKGRIDMLTTGVRTPIGIKLYGDDLAELERIGMEIEKHVAPLPGTRSVFAERAGGGYFVEITPRRDELARWGLSLADLQMTIATAVGGENVTQTIEGRERYPVQIRLPRELRDSVEKLQGLRIRTMDNKASVALEQVAQVRLATGPGMIRDENGRLASYVFVDVANRDLGSYVTELKKIVKAKVSMPDGYSIGFSGQYELMERMKARMLWIVPLTLFVIALLLYFNTRSMAKTAIVLLAVPFSLIGVIWILFLLDYNVSTAVWCGMIALLGVDAETGVFMLLYLDLAHDERKAAGRMNTVADLKEAIHDGAVKRLRPKMMTVVVMFVGLLPIMLSQASEIGADVMQRIAAPLVGGIFISFLMELLVYPSVYLLWRKRQLPRAG
ncbi:MAG: efflux RND transporter permease subunit [Spirochaetes bacterium]|nr:efflux RND transporter permease subunit [Spirochaetota bacterium]